jgi:hypothetical protein
MRSKGQTLTSADDHTFDVLQAMLIDTDKEYDIYFNITIPFTLLSNTFGK